MIKDAINKISLNENLSLVETREVFDEIIQGLTNETLIASFVTALHSKEPTYDELLGAILSLKDSIKKINTDLDSENFIQNISFSSFDEIFDVQLAVDLVCATCGLNVARSVFDSPLSSNRSFEVAKLLGVNTFEKNQEKFEKSNFSYIFLSKDELFYKYCFDISKKLPFENVLNIANNLFNPYGSKNCAIGLNKKELVEKYAQICLDLKYSNSIAFCGENKYPFVSISGETFVAEAWKNKIFTYVLTTDLVGLKTGNIEELKIDNSEHCKSLILELFGNKNFDSVIYDFVVINSALSLYIAKKANSVMEAVELAIKTIKDGLVLEKINQLKNIYS